MIFILALVNLLISQPAFAKSKNLQPPTIHGPDDRRDWYQVSNAKFIEWSKATVALLNKSDLWPGLKSDYSVQSPSYGAAKNLCSNMPFREQPTAANCSGFLVGPDLVVTAGHCVVSHRECKNTAFVFKYAVQTQGTMPTELDEEQVYDCKRLEATALKGAEDYSLIRLNRPVVDAKPLPIRRFGLPTVGSPVVLIGHPAGLPSKIAENAVITDSNFDALYANVDAFGGNSGSAVINARSGQVEGILIEGNPDFESNGSCNVEYKCGAACQGETIFPIANIAHLIPEF